jgi:hypothetical protein
MDRYGSEVWFYQTVGEPKSPPGIRPTKFSATDLSRFYEV